MKRPAVTVNRTWDTRHAASALPLSYNNRTTSSSPIPLHVYTAQGGSKMFPVRVWPENSHNQQKPMLSGRPLAAQARYLGFDSRQLPNFLISFIFTSNCLFFDQSQFNMNLICSWAGTKSLLVTYFSVFKLWFTLRASASAEPPDSLIPFHSTLWKSE